MAQPQPEKRSDRRFALDLPVTVKFLDNRSHEITGHTRDVSSRGIFFYTDTEIHTGSPIEFVMTLPTEVTQNTPLRVHCTGKVVRVDNPAGAEQGVAVAIQKYDFVRDA
jgi:PilZ domain